VAGGFQGASAILGEPFQEIARQVMMGVEGAQDDGAEQQHERDTAVILVRE
jgi:hypothetical protein